MPMYNEVWGNLMDEAKEELDKAEESAYPNGDLWESMVHLRVVERVVNEMQQLLINVSKTAFERVMVEKAK